MYKLICTIKPSEVAVSVCVLSVTATGLSKKPSTICTQTDRLVSVSFTVYSAFPRQISTSAKEGGKYYVTT